MPNLLFGRQIMGCSTRRSLRWQAQWGLDGIMTSGANVEYPTGAKLALVSLALCLSVFLIALDNTIIATVIRLVTTPPEKMKGKELEAWKERHTSHKVMENKPLENQKVVGEIKSQM